MPPAAKLLTGAAAIAVTTWLWHGPLGNGERFADGLEAQARAVVRATEVPGITVRMARSPLSRVAVLAGPADEFQRFGMGSQKGLTQMVEDVPGMGRARWADRPAGLVVPLIAEALALAALAYAIGLGLAWYVWGRKKGERFA